MKSPFNERKYRKLLEGLEATEILLGDLRNDNYECRIDSEYYKKKYLYIENSIKAMDFSLLSDVSTKISDGTHFTPTYVDKGIPFLSALNVQENYLDFNNNYQYITSKEHKLLYKRCNPEKNDILLRKVGVGARYACVIPPNLPEFSIFVSVALIKCKINPYYLACFINSKYGQEQLLRLNKGISQPDLHLEDIRRLKVPIFPINFQNKIENIVKSAHSKREQSQSLYRQAEDLLLETIGLKKFKPNAKTTNIKSFKESFLATGRLDAEYYQPKYEEIIAKIKKQPHDVLSNLVSIKKSIEPGSDVYTDEGLPFIRVSDYNKFGISTPEKCLSSNFCKENSKLLKSLYPTKETILFSKDGSVGTAYMVCENMQAITSGAILHLTVKDKTKVLPEYLTLVLNSIVVQQQAERDAGGSIILHWRINEIENVVVPVIDYKIQQQIAELTEQSFSLRAESEKLLEEAKGMVEREIEGENKLK